FITAEENLSSIEYRLMGGTLNVSGVLVNGISSGFTHANGIISIPLSISAGQVFTTKVSYSGIPGVSPAPYGIGLKFLPTGVYTLSNPEAGRYWWPCYDHPWDKALLDTHITVRSDWLVAGNGTRTGITDNGNGTRTHHWSSADPIATYVMGFAAGAFVEFQQQAGDIPIQNFVLPGQLSNAMIDFANTPLMIDHFSSLFGPYPFEKYGHAVLAITPYAAMEHQTMTTFASRFIDGQQTYESIVAHELAHQWYGNLITPIHMGQAWLKECFAVYSEALWVHRKLGWEAACNYIRSDIQQYYLSWENQNGPHTIFEPPYNLMFAPPTYEKSASVLHMLRLKMGNEDFFTFIRALLTTFEHGNYDTNDFINLAEQTSGLDLTQFFQQWIYSPGVPNASLAIFANDAHQVKVYARTTSPTATQFHIEIPLMLPNSAVCDSFVVTATPQGHINYFAIAPDDDISTILIDPNNWVLTRQLSRETLQLASCLPYDAAVRLSWFPYQSVADISGYRVYRRSLPEGGFELITPQIVTELSYVDASVSNGNTYQYYVCGVDSEGYVSLPSNIMEATPIAFPFDLGLLVIDETRNGSGAAISPNDEMVDEFYQAVLAGFAFAEWDFSSQGAPSLADMSRHPIILWHGDDFAEMLILGSLDTIGSYVLSGGKIVISGWKYPSVFGADFRAVFLPEIDLVYNNSAYFISAMGNGYPDLYPDPLKLSAVWNGMLPMTYTFAGAQNALYNAEIHPSGIGNGNPAVIEVTNNGTMVLCGFPLYFMQEEGVRGFLQELLPRLYPPLPVDDFAYQVLQPGFVCYPNPFDTRSALGIKVTGSLPSRLDIYNVRGQKIHSMQTALMAKNTSGHLLLDQNAMKHQASGCYILKLHTDKGTLTQKILLMK
ncbi:MAG: M1 family aminopeptidase, partial [Candidatus Cloacimonadaceae bacterium]|nr:M1 family aminopeptidase [Candidatus Cloacimonadaceae bacterium]